MKRILLSAGALLASVATQSAGANYGLFAYSNYDQAQKLSLDGAATILDTSQAEFLVDSPNQGWWNNDAANNYDRNTNYFVGLDFYGRKLNNFFTFSLRGVTGPVASADLILTRYESLGLPLTYTLWDVSTDAKTLNFNDGVNATIWADLGSGVSYGSVTVTDQALPDPLIISLNAAGLADLNAAIHAGADYFSIGGSVDSGVPEPDSLLLIGVAAAARLVIRRRS